MIVLLNYQIIIPEDSIKVHGITNEIMIESGRYKKGIKILFDRLCKFGLLVAHNIEFDETIISVECIRNFYNNSFKDIRTPRYCTMKRSIKRFKKWLRLEKLHENLFKESLQNLHNSLNDVYVCLRCFVKLYFNKDILRNEKFVNIKNSNIQEFKTSYSGLIKT